MSAPGHVPDPMTLAVTGSDAWDEHIDGCPSCAFRVGTARRLLGEVKSAGRPSHTIDYALPDPAKLAARGRARRAVRRRVRTLAAAVLVAVIGISGKLAQDHRRAVQEQAQDQADDALLRSIQDLNRVPDLGGLGSLVDAGIETGPLQG